MPLEPAELLFERLQEPSDDSPILYRERAYLVDSFNTDDDLEEHLEAELSRIRRDWRHRDASQFVQLSLFDQRFHGEPSLPPIATLSWKDWQGRTEIWVRGVRRSTLPPGVALDSLPPAFPPGKELPRFSKHPTQRVSPGALDELEEVDAVRELDPLDALDAYELSAGRHVPEAELDSIEEVEALDLGEPENDAPGSDVSEPVWREPDVGDAPESRRFTLPPYAVEAAAREKTFEAGADSPPDSGPGWQSPEKSGEYPIPIADDALTPPSSDRVLASEELIGALFERMHELSSVLSIGAGADYVIGALTEHIRCDGVLLHVFDARSGELVVARAVGPGASAVLTRRTRPAGSYLQDVLRSSTPLELGAGEVARAGVWPALGVSPGYVIAGSMLRGNEPLGLIELCRSIDKGPFSQGHLTALEYVCEQFAEFAADRPLDLERP